MMFRPIRDYEMDRQSLKGERVLLLIAGLSFSNFETAEGYGFLYYDDEENRDRRLFTADGLIRRPVIAFRPLEAKP